MENIKNNEHFLRLITDNKINLHQKMLIISRKFKKNQENFKLIQCQFEFS